MQGRDSDLIIKKPKTKQHTETAAAGREMETRSREEFKKGNYNQRHKTDKMGSQMGG